MVALDTVWFNVVRIRKTLRVTPAMAAGLTDRVWDMVTLIQQAERQSMTHSFRPTCSSMGHGQGICSGLSIDERSPFQGFGARRLVALALLLRRGGWPFSFLGTVSERARGPSPR